MNSEEPLEIRKGDFIKSIVSDLLIHTFALESIVRSEYSRVEICFCFYFLTDNYTPVSFIICQMI